MDMVGCFSKNQTWASSIPPCLNLLMSSPLFVLEFLLTTLPQFGRPMACSMLSLVKLTSFPCTLQFPLSQLQMIISVNLVSCLVHRSMKVLTPPSQRRLQMLGSFLALVKLSGSMNINAPSILVSL